MSGKRLLTRKQLGSVRQSVLAGVGFRAEHVKELVDHIEIVGMYAPEEPTPAEIAERLARAQEWVVVVKGGYDTWVSNLDQATIQVFRYRPSENLLQALDAAYALDMPHTMFVSNREYQVFTNICGEREISPPNLTSQQAAAWICMRLLEHLVEPLDSA